MFRVHLKGHPPRHYREAFLDPNESRRLGRLLDHLFDSGFIMINTCSATISTAMNEADIDALVSALEAGFAELLD